MVEGEGWKVVDWKPLHRLGIVRRPGSESCGMGEGEKGERDGVSAWVALWTPIESCLAEGEAGESGLLLEFAGHRIVGVLVFIDKSPRKRPLVLEGSLLALNE